MRFRVLFTTDRSNGGDSMLERVVIYARNICFRIEIVTEFEREETR